MYNEDAVRPVNVALGGDVWGDGRVGVTVVPPRVNVYPVAPLTAVQLIVTVVEVDDTCVKVVTSGWLGGGRAVLDIIVNVAALDGVNAPVLTLAIIVIL